MMSNRAGVWDRACQALGCHHRDHKMVRLDDAEQSEILRRNASGNPLAVPVSAIAGAAAGWAGDSGGASRRSVAPLPQR